MANVNSVSSSSSTSSLYGSRNVLTGLATGMDTEAMIENSISSYKTKISGFQQQQTKIEWQQEAYRSITDKMIELGSKYTSYTSSTNLTSASFFNAATKTVAAGTYASKVSATGKSDNDIQINSATMATAARFTADLGNGVTANTTLSELNSGLGDDFSLTINGTEIKGLSGDSTVSDLMNAINSSDAGVKASFSSITGEMVFTATETGANSAINFSGNLKQLFGLREDEELTQSENYSAGNDAVLSVVVNGTTTTVTSSSNTFNLDGLNVTLKGNFKVTGTQEAVSFTTQTDADKIVSAVKSFVDDYNAIMKEVHSGYTTQPLTKSSGSSYEPLTDSDKDGMSDKAIEAYEEKAKTGLLFGDNDLSNLYNEMRSAISSLGLSEIGLSTEYDSDSKVTTLKLDEDKLRETLSSDPDKVKKAFVGDGTTGGLASKTGDTVKKYASTSMAGYGILVKKAGTTKKATSLLDNTLQKQIDSLDDDISKWTTKMNTQVDYYTRMFSQLETLMNTMNSQSSMLSGLMGG